MSMPADYSTGKQGVAILPLALILALHLLLVLLWPSKAHMATDQGAAQRHITLTWLPALKPRAPPSQALARSVRPLAAPAPRAPKLAPSSAAEPHTVQEEMQQRSSVPDALEVSQMIESAKRQAGLIDRALRGGKAAPLAPDADLPIARLRSALESAYIDRSRTAIMDFYTYPDGVIVYRTRRGGKTWCRQSGGGGPSSLEYSEGAKLAGAGSMGGAGKAGTVTCPSGESGWSRL